MKKRLLFYIFSLTSLVAFSQNDTICGKIPSKNGKVCYENVITDDNIKAETLYSNAKIWVANNFGSANSVIQTDIPNTSLVLKGILEEDSYTTYKFTLTLQFKDGRYKYILTDLYYHFMSVSNPVEEMPFMKTCIEKTVNEFDLFFKSFLNRVHKGITEDSDW